MNNQFSLLNFIYTLKLEEDKYYIGSTGNPNERIQRHYDGDGAEWTKKYKPVSVLEVICAEKELENIKTLQMMALKGYPNVRGGAWCQVVLNQPPKPLRFSYNEPNYNSFITPENNNSEKENSILKVSKTEFDSHIASVYDEILAKKIKEYVYVLELEQQKFYIGSNYSANNNFERHFLGEGPPWTQTYKPVSVVRIIPGNRIKEKQITLQYMRKYGWTNVRGYAWSQINLKNPPKDLRL